MLSSSLPAREGALESSNGEANGPLSLLSLLPASELQLVLLDDIADPDRGLSVGMSWYLGGALDFDGGSSISVDCATSGAPYIAGPPAVRVD